MNVPLVAGARFIGERIKRKEDARLLTGRGTFVDDVILPGMLHAAFHRSPIATTTIRHQRIAHSPMETRGVVVSTKGEGELNVHIG